MFRCVRRNGSRAASRCSLALAVSRSTLVGKGWTRVYRESSLSEQMRRREEGRRALGGILAPDQRAGGREGRGHRSAPASRQALRRQSHAAPRARSTGPVSSMCSISRLGVLAIISGANRIRDVHAWSSRKRSARRADSLVWYSPGAHTEPVRLAGWNWRGTSVELSRVEADRVGRTSRTRVADRQRPLRQRGWAAATHPRSSSYVHLVRDRSETD